MACKLLIYQITEVSMGHGVSYKTCGMFLVMSLDGSVRLQINSPADLVFLGSVTLSAIRLNQISSLNLIY